MTTARCLLCLPLVLWVALAFTTPPTPRPYFRRIIDLVQLSNNHSLDEGSVFVDSARELSEGPGRCGAEFFCTVHDILHKHSIATKGDSGQSLVRVLNNFNNDTTNCTKFVMNPRKTTEQVPLRSFLDTLKKCCRCRYLNASTSSC